MTLDGYMPAADAAMYICGGCMEINPQGLMSDLFWSFRYNMNLAPDVQREIILRRRWK